MEDCIFCKIIEGEIESRKLYENDHVFVMLDAEPVSPGHSMILPKTHVENILELPDEEAEPFFRAIKKAAEMIESSLNPDGFTMGINHKVGQAIDHLHFHVIPRWNDDKGTSLHGVVTNKPEKSLDEIQKQILNDS